VPAPVPVDDDPAKLRAPNPQRRQEREPGERSSEGGGKVLVIVLDVIGGIILLACLGVGGCVYLVGRGVNNVADEVVQKREQERARDAEARKAPSSVSIAQLLADYRANEVAGDQMYKDRWLKVRGEVESATSADVLDNLHVDLKTAGEYGEVTCYFDDSFAGRAAKLSRGQTITVVGKCRGKVLSSVSLRDCELVNAEPAGKESGSPAPEPAEARNLKSLQFQNPRTPFTVRGECRLTTFYNWEFLKVRNTLYSVELTQPEPHATVHCYISKDSDDGKRVFQLQGNGEVKELTPECQFGENSVSVTKLIRVVRWE
jgi:hypothetical protein